MANLIHLAQIKGGKQLRTDIDALQASYDAYKVLTDIAKDGGGNYNVNEMLVALKASITALEGSLGSGGSVDDKIDAATADLQGKIDLINNKAIKDRVKLTAVLKSTPAVSLVINGDVGTLVPNIDTVQKYVIYDAVTNRAIQNETGGALLYDFATSQVVGTPSKADPADKDPMDGVTYIPLVDDVNVKLFPVGEFTFSQLSPDYLLDNEELNLVAYDNAIDRIVVDLAQDQELIDSIKALVGTETVQNQIKLITDALAVRIAANEADLATLKGTDAEPGSVAHSVKTAQDALQANIDAEAVTRAEADTALGARIDAIEGAVGGGGSVDTKIAEAIAAEAALREAADTALQGAIDAEKLRAETAEGAISDTVEANRKTAHNANLDRVHDIALINAKRKVRDKMVGVVDSQVSFPLTESPDTELVLARINGVEYVEGDEFTVDRAQKTVTWTATAANEGFDIQSTFKVEFRYQVVDAVVPPVHI